MLPDASSSESVSATLPASASFQSPPRRAAYQAGSLPCPLEMQYVACVRRLSGRKVTYVLSNPDAHMSSFRHTLLSLEVGQTAAGGTDVRARSLSSGCHPRDEVPEIRRLPRLFLVGSFQREAPKSLPQGQGQGQTMYSGEIS